MLGLICPLGGGGGAVWMYVDVCLSVCRHIHEERLQNSMERRSYGTRWEMLAWGTTVSCTRGHGCPTWRCGELFLDLFFRKSGRWWLLY